jgi:hypothetical protein
VVFRALKAKKRPILSWALLGVISGPWCWVLFLAPLAVLTPETPQQILAREKAEKEKKVADQKAERAKAEQEEKRKFLEWANGVNPLVGCKTELKNQLRDPGSYQDDWAQPKPIIDESKKTVSYVWSFRSKNGFGGYMSAAAACESSPEKDSSSSNWGGHGNPQVEIIQSQ